MSARIVQGALLVAGLGGGVWLLVESGSGPPTEGPPRPAPTFESFAGVAVILFTLGLVALLVWDPGLRRSQAWALRGALVTGMLVAVGLGGLAVRADVYAPHNLTECGRDGVTHQIACSYNQRNTMYAQNRAMEFGVGAVLIVVLLLFVPAYIYSREHAATTALGDRAASKSHPA